MGRKQIGEEILGVYSYSLLSFYNRNGFAAEAGD